MSSVDGTPEQLFGDRDLLFQVIMHLLHNATKFTPDGAGTIQLRFYVPAPNQWGFQIIDPGIGIEPGTLAYIFDAFRQADEGITRHYFGLGLGLYISHQLVQRMRGEITVESQVGQGSIFSVNLPSQHPCDGTMQ